MKATKTESVLFENTLPNNINEILPNKVSLN